jgi:chromosome segregation ATPase
MKEQKLLLNFEKDKVIMLEKSIDSERKARMEEIYKQDRQTKDFKFVEKDLSRLNSMNQDMVNEFEAVKKENIALAEVARQLQDNKDSILQELQRYELQVAELEAHNTDLRSRLYNSDAERDKFQVQCDKLKAKLERHKSEMGGLAQFSSAKSSKQGLAPLRQTKVRAY